MAKLTLNVDTFCIDRTEVTRAHYEAFVADGAPTPATVPDVCRGTSHTPDAACAAADGLCKGADCGKHPQTCVSYCDAAAFCAWSGKEMCGQIGGGYALRKLSEPRNPGRWVAACGDGLRDDGAPAVPYANAVTYSADRCNTETGDSAPVGTYPGCTLRNDTSVVDMIGNVAELNGLLFERNEATKTFSIAAHGGAGFGTPAAGAQATCGATISLETVSSREPFIGFRCCKNAS